MKSGEIDALTYLHVTNAVADAGLSAPFAGIEAVTRLIGSATVARPRTGTPIRPTRPFLRDKERKKNLETENQKNRKSIKICHQSSL